MSLSKYVAELYDTEDIISVYGNFSMFKKNASLPQHISNTMSKEDLVVFFAKNGIWTEVDEVAGYKVYRIEAGTAHIYLCSAENQIRYIIGI